eukprot:659391-Pyramimonas_sp.AAC.1
MAAHIGERSLPLREGGCDEQFASVGSVAISPTVRRRRDFSNIARATSFSCSSSSPRVVRCRRACLSEGG